jgi:cytoskeletal protein CcmA (bactofilin family)
MFKRYKTPFDKEPNTALFDAPNESSPNTEPYPKLPKEAPPRIFANETPQNNNTAPQIEAPFSRPSSIRKTPQKPTLNGEQPDTTLGEGVCFKGELTFRQLLRIDGQFEGDLVSTGKLIVGPTGIVKSNVTMREAIIEGVVEGNITVTDRLELRKEAKVLGNIQAPLLSVDEGVVIVGHVSVTPENQKSVEYVSTENITSTED